MRYERTTWIVGGLGVGIALFLIGRPGRMSADRREPSRTSHEAVQGSIVGPIAAPAAETSTKGRPMKKATFGAGCFWGVESTFRRIPGVIETAVGYAGGQTENPTYKEVCTDRTGHAEVVEVEYDPSKVSYGQLLDVFWSSHDPTQVNRQGPDYGTQYRTVIFYHDDEQKAESEASKQKLEASGRFPRPIATQIVPAGPFYRAEEYHQRYLEKRGLENCHI
jgi:peptide-methionine (S)-S-oxide reductase